MTTRTLRDCEQAETGPSVCREVGLVQTPPVRRSCSPFRRCSILVVVDGAGIVQWMAIGLAFVAVILILRYARQPRCEVCSRRHARPDHGAQSPEVGFLGVEVPEAADCGAISWKAE